MKPVINGKWNDRYRMKCFEFGDLMCFTIVRLESDKLVFEVLHDIKVMCGNVFLLLLKAFFYV